MPENPNKLFQFWQELKRRKVVRVIIVYAAASFVILELVSIIAEPFGLPDWTLKFVFVILCVGFIISIILSWVYDITPEGIEKTKPIKEAEEEVPEKPSGFNTWKIATFMSIVIIVGLVLFNILGSREKTDDIAILDKSIAVLPFKSLSDDPEKQYLADGAMDAILLHLSKIKDLRVMSRTSVEQYRETDKTATIICQELDVAYLLEGSFQKYGDQGRLIVQLINPGKEGHEWVNEYDRSWEDIFSVQSEVAQTIAKELQAVITPDEKQLIAKIPTENLTAYDLFLKGNDDSFSFWSEGDLNLIYQSIVYFMQAIELDPEYSFAYTGQGKAYWMLGHFAPDRSTDHWLESLRLLNKAISLDSTNGWAYSELGVVAWDSIAARDAFDKARDISPNNRDVFNHYTYLASRMGDCKKLNSLLLQMEDRFHIDVNSDLNGYSLRLRMCREDFESISRIANFKWDYNTDFPETRYLLDACIIVGNYDKARELYEFIDANFDDLRYGAAMTGLAYRGILYAMEDNQAAAENIIDQLVTLSSARLISPINMASVYLAMGDIENSKSYLEQALDERDFYIHEIQHIAPFYLHKDEPWIKDIIRRSWIPWPSIQTSSE
jgi:TolB-like protein